MLRTFRSSIRLRFLAAFAAFLVLLAGLSYWIEYQARIALENELDNKLIAIAAAASNPTIISGVQLSFVLNFTPGDENTRTYRIIRDRLNQLKESTGVERLGMWNFDGRILIDSDSSTIAGLNAVTANLYRTHLEQARRGESSASFLFPGRGGRVHKMGFAPLIRDGVPQAVIVAEGNAGFLASAGRMRRVLVLVGAVALLLGALAAWGLTSSVTSPLRRMAQAARLIGGGDLESPVMTSGPGEVGELGLVLEGMRKDLQHRDQQLRSMVAGVAHEIRNPLGGLVLYADLLGQDPTLSEEGRGQAAKILREANILERIVEEFHIFARPTETHLEPIRLSFLWEEVRPLVEGRINEHRATESVTLKWEECWDVDEFSADRRQLRQILLNLALNAAEALGKEGGVIRISSSRDGDGVLLEVEDSGPGVDPSKYEEALEPFITTKARGAGLGLPMVERLARAHGGSVTLDSSDLGGLAVRIRIPQTTQTDGSLPKGVTA